MQTSRIFGFLAVLLAGGAAWAAPAPKNLRATDGKFPDKVQVTWKAVAGAQGYYLYRSQTTNINEGGRFPLQAAVNFEDSTVTDRATYRYWVTAVVNGVESSLSNFDDGFRKDTASAGEGGGITGVVADSFTLSSGFSYGGDLSLVFTTSAYTSNPESPFGEIFVAAGSWSGTAPAREVPAVVTGRATEVTGTSAVLNGMITSEGQSPIVTRKFEWVEGTDMTNAQSSTEVVDGQPYTPVGSGTTIRWATFQYTLTGLKPGTTYAVRASAQNGSTQSLNGLPAGWDQGGVMTFTTPGLPPPASVTATDGTYKDRVQVTWPAVDGAAGYVVYRGTEDNADAATAFPQVATPAFDDTTAVKGTIYTYWVKTVKGGGTGGFGASDTGFLKGTKVPKKKK